MTDTPRWNNRCPHCRFLLRHGDYDYWYCPNHSTSDFPNAGEVVARIERTRDRNHTRVDDWHFVWKDFTDHERHILVGYCLALVESSQRGFVSKRFAAEKLYRDDEG